MAAKGGKDFLLKIEDSPGAGTYTYIAGLRECTMTINNEAIDVTNHGSNQYKEILDAAGIRSMSVSGSGVFTDGANLSTIRANILAGTLTRFQVVDANSGDTFTAYFKITSFERGGSFDAEQNYSVSLESSGAITVS